MDGVEHRRRFGPRSRHDEAAEHEGDGSGGCARPHMIIKRKTIDSCTSPVSNTL